MSNFFEEQAWQCPSKVVYYLNNELNFNHGNYDFCEFTSFKWNHVFIKITVVIHLKYLVKALVDTLFHNKNDK